MLYLIGMGLHDENDITLKAIEAAKKCDAVYCELFTGKWRGNIKKLEKLLGRKIVLLKRKDVESDLLIGEAKKKSVALLVPGDPLAATTHIELVIEARKNNIKTKVVHASSVFTAIAETGLQLYKFGRTTTLPFPRKNFSPASPFDIIKSNKRSGLHTLVLLDVNEDYGNMSAKTGAEILLKNIGDINAMACCCLGGESIIKFSRMSKLAKMKELEKTPAAIVIPGNLHFKEEEALELWK